MDIRRAEIKDVLPIAQVVVDAWKIAYKGIISQSYLNKLTTATYTERFKRQINAQKVIFLVAEIDAEIVGMLQARVLDKELFVDMLYVSPNHQRKGVGKSLLQHIIQTCCVNKIVLDVLERNIGGKKFYSQQGFMATGCKRKSEINAGVFIVEKFERIVKKS